MFKSFLYFFSLIFSISLFAQVGKVDTTSKNYKAFYYSNQQISSHGILENGKPNGYWISYYENGLLKSEGNRENYLLDGPWIFYNEFGDKAKIINYKEEVKNGLTISYDDSCYIIKEEPYVNGIIEGIVKNFYPTKDKILESEIPFNENKENGTAYFYAKDGRVILIVDYNKGFISRKEEINRYDKNNLKVGIWKTFYNNRRTKTEATYKNNLLNGYLKYYSPDGQLDKAELYIDGILQEEGENSINFEIIPTYSDNGKVIEETTYNALGQKDGVSRQFNDSGEVVKSSIFNNDFLIAEGGTIDKQGRKQGYWKEYYLNGKLKNEGEYLDNQKYNKWKYYYENGKAEQIGKYNKNGKPINDWIWYYQNGDTLRYEQYRMGFEDGFLVEKTDSGTVITKGDYIDGYKEGEWYYEMNDHIEKGKYVYGTKNGLWEHFHINGEKVFEGKFIEDRPEGRHRWWYPNGKIRMEGNFSYGEKDGIWKKYDELGNLLITIQYKDGKEYKIDGQKFKTEKN